MPLSKKKPSEKRPSYEIGEFRDPKITELQVQDRPRSKVLSLIKKAVTRKPQHT